MSIPTTQQVENNDQVQKEDSNDSPPDSPSSESSSSEISFEDCDDPVFELPIGPNGKEIPTSYIIEKIHTMGKDLFNNPKHASCILRVISSSTQVAFGSVSDTDQFYWIHEVVLVSQSPVFKRIFDDQPEADPSVHTKPIKEGGVKYQWQAIRTLPGTKQPVICPYQTITTNAHSRRSSYASTTSSSSSRPRPTFPLLTMFLPNTAIFPELLYYVYTGDEERFMRAVKVICHQADIPKKVALSILDVLGFGHGLKRRREDCYTGEGGRRGSDVKRALVA